MGQQVYIDDTIAGQVGYQSVLPDASLTGSVNDGDVRDSIDRLLYTFWVGDDGATITVDCGTDQSVDYLGMVGMAGSFDLAWSADGVSFTAIATGLSAATVLFHRFASVTARYFRLTAHDDGDGVTVAHWQLGTLLWVPPVRGDFTPPELADDVRLQNTRAEKGTPLGHRVREHAQRFDWPWRMMDADWIAANWRSFADHARVTPFFARWHDGAPPAWCWTDDRPLTPPSRDGSRFLSTVLSLRSYVEGVS